MRVGEEVRRSSPRVSEAMVSFVSKVRCLLSFWHVPVWAREDARREIGGERENWGLRKQQEKDSWNPDSICHSDSACVPNKSPSVDEVAGMSGSPPGASRVVDGVSLHPMWRVQRFTLARPGWDELFLLFLGVSAAGCPSQSRSLQSSCGASA